MTESPKRATVMRVPGRGEDNALGATTTAATSITMVITGVTRATRVRRARARRRSGALSPDVSDTTQVST